MKNLNDALLKIKKNPIKYIGRKSITRLDHFITGYVLSQRDEAEEYPEALDKFQEFVQQKYNVTYNLRYSEIIKMFSVSEEQAFDNFYKLFEAFQKEN